ncbi:MAG: D-glycero-beta-D-manno-heptose-7-phosphate kinase [bacterium]|nr:D-glycero-beta-D-manno-heptose-7-phosphate kinase [bacterium]
MIKLKKVKEICSQFQDKKILIFGDVILDRYIFGSVDRISPEAPVPVVKVASEELRCGGAGNVAANIDKLGAQGLLMGITGDDTYADQLSQLKTHGNLFVRSKENRTLVKTRVISQRQQIVRIDREKDMRVTPEVQQAIEAAIDAFSSGDIHGIVVSDYAKGTLNQRFMRSLALKAQALSIPIIVDPKPPNYHLYKNITGITPNLKEAEALVNRRIESDGDAAAAIKSIRNKFNTHFSMITRGSHGITAGERGKRTFHLPAFNHEVFDVTGAGDTVVSVLILSLVSGANLREAVALSNAAASIVVEKIGASQVTTRDIYERMKFLLRKENYKLQ